MWAAEHRAHARARGRVLLSCAVGSSKGQSACVRRGRGCVRHLQGAAHAGGAKHVHKACASKLKTPRPPSKAARSSHLLVLGGGGAPVEVDTGHSPLEPADEVVAVVVCSPVGAAFCCERWVLAEVAEVFAVLAAELALPLTDLLSI